MDDQLITTVSQEDVMRGKYLTFDVAENSFGLEISYVTEIIGIQNITRVPHTYPYIKGIINLRGTIIPVMDMRARFMLESIAYTDRTCIIVIDTADISIGLIVDQVSEVVDITDDHIQAPPKSTAGGVNNYIRAIATVEHATDSEVTQLLDLQKIF